MALLDLSDLHFPPVDRRINGLYITDQEVSQAIELAGIKAEIMIDVLPQPDFEE